MRVAFVHVPLAVDELMRHPKRYEDEVPEPVCTVVHPAGRDGAVVLPLRNAHTVCRLPVAEPDKVQEVVPVQWPFWTMSADAGTHHASATSSNPTLNKFFKSCQSNPGALPVLLRLSAVVSIARRYPLERFPPAS